MDTKNKKFKKRVALLLTIIMLVTSFSFTGGIKADEEAGSSIKQAQEVLAPPQEGSEDKIDKGDATSASESIQESIVKQGEENPQEEVDKEVFEKSEEIKELGNKEILTKKGGKDTIAPLSIISPTVPTYTYIFKVEKEDGTFEQVDKQIVKDGEKLLEPKSPEKEGYRFLGWYEEITSNQLADEKINFTKSIVVGTSSKTINVIAKFEKVWHVKFVYNDQVLKTKEVGHGQNVNDDQVPLNITEEGKAFKHWSLVKNGPDAYDFNRKVTSDLVLYVVLKDAWKVTFDSDGGSAVLPIYVDDGSTLDNLEKPTKAGYAFDGWVYADSGDQVDPGAQVKRDLKLKANWTPASSEYKVIYWLENAEDDEYTFDSVEEKTGITGTRAQYGSIIREGFHYDHHDEGVKIAADGSTVVNVYYKRNIYKFTIEVQKFGRWNRVYWDTYSRVDLKYGQSTAPYYNAAAEEYPNYSWYTEPDDNTAYSEAPKMPNEDLTIYGRKSENVEYVIAYVEKTSGEEIHDRYKFKGNSDLYFTIEDGIEIEGFTVNDISEWRNNLKAYGIWGKHISKIYYTRNNYTLTFHKYNGASNLVVENIPYQKDISDKDTTGLSSESSKIEDGIKYYFAGWYDNSDFVGQPYDLTGKTMPASNLALYAKWVQEKYTVTFYKTINQEGEVYETVEDITPLHTIVNPGGPGSNEEFVAWYWYLGDKFVPFDFNTPISGNFNLFPVYKNQVAQVSYDSNGGSGTVSDNSSYLIGSEAPVKASEGLSKEGYVFIGWNTQDNGSGEMYYQNSQITVPKEGVTLYAQWEKVKNTTKVIYQPGVGAEGNNLEEEGLLINDKISLKEFPEEFRIKDGYTFIGWLNKTDGEIYKVADELQVDDVNEGTKNILVAQYSREIIVTKEVTGNMGERNRDFNFTYRIKKVNGESIESATFSLAHGEERKFDLRPNQVLVITEGSYDNEGYETRVNGVTRHAIEWKQSDGDKITFRNIKEIPIPTGLTDNNKPMIFTLTISMALAAAYVMSKKAKKVED
ncbi:MAG: InlB B-repeat-containing protein [Tissierellia bacterium]|nr:InlB B-repeat-containing protein [Tissierellia bacterium]